MRRTRILPKTIAGLDTKLLSLTLLLTVLGLIAVADASAPLAARDFGNQYFFVKQQLVWAGIGLVGLFVISRIPYTFWQKVAVPLFAVNLILLLVVFIPGIGPRLLGAKRWIIVGPMSFQPAELMKMSLAIYMAKVGITKTKPIAFFAPIILVVGLVMLEPDLGTTIVLTLIGMSQVFIAGLPLSYFGMAGGVGILGLLGLILGSAYRRERLLTFFKQTSDPLDSGYHIRQILLALGSGGLFGVGLGHSRQKYSFLPETATDSIFAIIAEEIGFIGALCFLSLFVYFVYRGIQIAKNAPDDFSKLLAIGLTVWIGGQVFVNIASMVALVPLTGIPLPFISYGGTALVTNLAAVGILLNISKNSRN
jgi:cell division protein FtsW